jgi:hypothetical protein
MMLARTARGSSPFSTPVVFIATGSGRFRPFTRCILQVAQFGFGNFAQNAASMFTMFALTCRHFLHLRTDDRARATEVEYYRCVFNALAMCAHRGTHLAVAQPLL